MGSLLGLIYFVDASTAHEEGPSASSLVLPVYGPALLY
jgi:hypothetical protein